MSGSRHSTPAMTALIAPPMSSRLGRGYEVLLWNIGIVGLKSACSMVPLNLGVEIGRYDEEARSVHRMDATHWRGGSASVGGFLVDSGYFSWLINWLPSTSCRSCLVGC